MNVFGETNVPNNSELKSANGYPIIERIDGSKKIIFSFDNLNQQFRLIKTGIEMDTDAVVKKNWGYLTPENMPTFEPPFRSAAITVTSKCNMQCPYCFVYPVKRRQNMTKAKAREVVKALRKQMTCNHSQIYMWGGEPTLNPDALMMVLDTIAEEFGETCTVTITTNGTASKAIMEKVSEYSFATFQISYDGNYEVQNQQKMMDGGSYHQVMDNLNLVNALDRAPSIRMTVTDRNVNVLPDIFDNLLASGITKRICIEPVHAYVGRSTSQIEHQPDARVYAENLIMCVEKAEKAGCSVYSQPLSALLKKHAYSWGFVNILPDGQAASTISVIDSSHEDMRYFKSGEIIDGELVLDKNIAIQYVKFIEQSANKCVFCPLLCLCKGNEQRDFFVADRMNAGYRCEVFIHLVDVWLNKILDKILKKEQFVSTTSGAWDYDAIRSLEKRKNIIDFDIERIEGENRK